MLAHAESHYAEYEGLLREVDPELNISSISCGWFRQTNMVYGVPRSHYLPGRDGLLYHARDEDAHIGPALVYYDEVAWELHVTYGKQGDYLQATIYLAPDGVFLCSSLCHNEHETGFQQALVPGDKTGYTLQTWMAGAGMYQFRSRHGGMSRSVSRPVSLVRRVPDSAKVPTWYNSTEKVEAALRIMDTVAATDLADLTCNQKVESGNAPIRYLHIGSTVSPNLLIVQFYFRRSGGQYTFLIRDLGTPTQRLFLLTSSDRGPSRELWERGGDVLAYYACPIQFEDDIRLLYDLSPRRRRSVPSEDATNGSSTSDGGIAVMGVWPWTSDVGAWISDTGTTITFGN